MVGVVQTSGLGRAIDTASAALFAAAGGYSVLLATSSMAGAAAAATAAFVGARLALGRIDDSPRYRLPDFQVGEVEAEASAEPAELLLTELTELLLTEAMIAPVGADDELLLEDRLENPDDNSRVIRLFDPRTLPSAGDLYQRIERHGHDRQSAAFPDATAELHRALADLRRALR
jgi:hypothetical protein